MFILRVFLVGMIAFVPTRDDRSMWVLLPNAIQAATASDAHYPIFTFSKSDIVGSAERNEWVKIKGLVNGREDADSTGWLLAGERISLNIDRSFSLAKASTKKPGTLLPETDEESWDLTWIPRLSEVTRKAAPVKRQLIDRPSKGSMAALLELKHGFLRTYALSRYGDVIGPKRDKLISFGFAPAGTQLLKGNCSQALAEIVVVEIPVLAPSIKIETQTFDGKPGSSVTLKPAPGKATVDVMLANLPPSTPDELKDRSLPAHFHHYYDLLPLKAQGKRLIPVYCEPETPMVETTRLFEPPLIDPPPLYMRTVYEDAGRASIARPICTPVMFDSM